MVERSTIMAHLFSKPSCSTASDAVLSALLSVFSRYVRRMRKSKEGEEVYSWVRAPWVSNPAGGTGHSEPGERRGWSSGSEEGMRWTEAVYSWGISSVGDEAAAGTGWVRCHTMVSPTL